MQLIYRQCGAQPLQGGIATQRRSRQHASQPAAQLRGQVQHVARAHGSRSLHSLSSSSLTFQAGASFLDAAAARLLAPTADAPARQERSRSSRW